jgi:DNA polymerase-1
VSLECPPARGGRARPPRRADLAALCQTSWPREYETITTWERFDALAARSAGRRLVAIDTETDSLDGDAARIVGISFAVEPGRAAYVPLAHSYPGVPDQLPLPRGAGALKPWLEDASRAKLGQNIKYDLHVLANAGITVRGYRHDTMLQSYVLEAHARTAWKRWPSATWAARA